MFIISKTDSHCPLFMDNSINVFWIISSNKWNDSYPIRFLNVNPEPLIILICTTDKENPWGTLDWWIWAMTTLNNFTNGRNKDTTEQIMAFSKKYMCKTTIKLTCYLKIEKTAGHRWIFENMAFFSSLYHLIKYKNKYSPASI